MLYDGGVLVVRLMKICSLWEFQPIEDAFAHVGQRVHNWCLLTGNPPAPTEGEEFQFAYIMAHGRPDGCSFCSEESCVSMQEQMQRVCEYLTADAIVFAACCWCGSDEAASQVACGCASSIAEVIGPVAQVAEVDMHSLASTFFGRVAGGATAKEAVFFAGEHVGIELAHNYTRDLDLRECEP